MAKTSFADRLAVLKENLLSVPPERLVDMLMERVVYDDSLRKYLEVMAKAKGADVGAGELFEIAKQVIATAYGDETLDEEDASHHVPELYAAQSIVEQIFEKGHYQQVIDLFDWSLQFEEKLSGACEPDDFLETAYKPLAILCLRSHLRLGKTPEEVAKVYQKLGDADEYGLFFKLGHLWPKDEADLAPVREILEKTR